MARPYTLDPKSGAYLVMQKWNGINAYRRSRTAAGMTATLERSGHSVNSDALALAVRGTTDVLGGQFGNKMKKHRSRYYRAETVTRWIKKES